MNSGPETVDHSRLLPLKKQIRKDSGDTGTISPLSASFPSAFAPLLVSVTSSRSSRSSPYPNASASPCLGQKIASGTREEWNAARPSDRAQGKSQGTENEARMNSVPSIAQPQSRWAPKQPEEVKPFRRGQGRPRGRKSRVRVSSLSSLICPLYQRHQINYGNNSILRTKKKQPPNSIAVLESTQGEKQEQPERPK